MRLLGDPGEVCVRLARRPDGTVVTRRGRTARRLAALVAYFGMAGAVGGGEGPKPSQGKLAGAPSPDGKPAPGGPGHE